jgi:hypothetical protein
MLKSSSLCLYSSNFGTFWLKIEQFWPFEEISNKKKGGMKLKKLSSPLKLLSQFQPNFAEMILRWSPFKIVSVSAVLYPRWNAGHNFGRGPPKNHFSKVWLRLAL